MKRSHPAVATWLLQRFMGPEREAFVGDLREQYGQGRSRLWYWRQTLTAMAVGTLAAIGNDRSLPFRAIFAGLCTKVWFGFPVRFIASVFVHDFPALPAHVSPTTWAALRPEMGVVPCIILAISGVGASRSFFLGSGIAGSKPGIVGPMTLCWAAAWMVWTIAIARFAHTDWIAVQALMQTASIVIGGLLVPATPRQDDHKLTTLGL
jgi:hypothetical protein